MRLQARASVVIAAAACMALGDGAAAETPVADLVSTGVWAGGPPADALTPCALSCTRGVGRCDDATACADRRWYVSGIVGASFANVASGGVNTAEGGFANTGSTSDQLFTAGGALGMAFARPGGQLRTEIEARGRNELSGTTEGFQPPAATTTYAVRAADGWLVTANLWRDFFLTQKFGVYGGGGIGGGGYRISVTDGFVAGAGNVGAFAWQAGGGAFYRINDRITLDLGYRFFQNDRLTTPLQDLASEAPSGSYSSLFSASEVLLSVRIYEPFARWRR